MAENCENCGHAVLKTDTVCWHCGHQLPRRTTLKAPPPKTAVKPEPIPKEPYNLRAIGVYGALTAVIIVAIILVMRSLGQQPLVIVNNQTFIRRGWTPITDEDQRYTFDLPDSWQVWRASQPDFADLLAENDSLETAVAIWTDVAQDTTIQLVAFSEPPEDSASGPTFILIAHSAQLGGLALERIVTAVAERENVSEASVVLSPYADQRVTFITDLSQTKDQLICQHQLASARREAFIIIGCNPTQGISTSQERIRDILSSFQLLTQT